MIVRRATSADVVAVVALQRAAYAKNRPLLGVEPLPLQADYTDVVDAKEVWLAESETGLDGVLILEPRERDLLIWSIATDPARPPAGTGRDLLAWAEIRAAELERDTVRLYTGTKLAHLVAWYGRHGYVTECVEELQDRSITHMVKRLGSD
jgi:N-acetylglutamate synthase-like GNAT family acetyltransferase